jgi:hypothetical protein
MAAGSRRKAAGLLPFLLLVVTAALVGGMLVAWRRLDASMQRHHQSPQSGPGLQYETQAIHDREEEVTPAATAVAVAATEPYKTLVIYVYHERCVV